jgi:hypothetical protein
VADLDEQTKHRRAQEIPILMRKCRHFNGIQHNECEAGVSYSTVRAPLSAERAAREGRSMALPCFGDAEAACDRRSYLSREEAEAKWDRDEETTAQTLEALAEVSRQKEKSGSIVCPRCLGVLRYARASNGHSRALCNTEGCISWIA